MLKMNREEFQSACQRQGVDVTDKQLDQLEKYLHLLMKKIKSGKNTFMIV